MAVRDIASAPRTTTLPRPAAPRTRGSRPSAYVPTPKPGVKPHVPHSGSRGRLGSQQVVSVRGRRVAAPVQTKRRFSAVGGMAVFLLVVGIAIAMVLSGLSTTQTFTIQQLQSQERQLKNEVESLNRDLEDLRSSAEIAQRAADAGMLVASQPGIVEVAPDGHVETRREFNPESVAPVMDVNGAPVRADRATSDRGATEELGDSLTPLPGGNVIGDRPQGPEGAAAPRFANVAPYQPNVPPAF
ncbi:hypothetical protein JZY91_07435 [Corynebacterium sp. CNCTC7651]|uniref:hypothetical protein n=1 Tax=Corynebacterium sp. CNCTC7651 TaxID=2815361 RepID=UPI001F2FB0F0|nr:hypothetical protein [Corynebacterium sp. CNCTC7651]UIZ91580.1 hypothetical protein JZY91_07435 [Corynebacterium sp. CNCTC7651]